MQVKYYLDDSLKIDKSGWADFIKDLDNVINYPGVDVTFIGGKGTKLYPQTPGIQKMYDDVLDDIWDTVYDYTGISLELYAKYVKDCGKENIYLR